MMRRRQIPPPPQTEYPPLDSIDEACVSACNRDGLRVHVCHANEAPEVILQAMTQNQNDSQQHVVQLAIFRVMAAFPIDDLLTLVSTIRSVSRQLFICIFSPRISEDPMHRYQCFAGGASMVTNSLDDLSQILRKLELEVSLVVGSKSSPSWSSSSILGISSSPAASSSILRTYTCPFCGKNGLTEDALWSHCPLFHINEKNRSDMRCPICVAAAAKDDVEDGDDNGKTMMTHHHHHRYHQKKKRKKNGRNAPFQVHLHNAHGPPGRGELPSEFRNQSSDSLSCFSLVVCRHPYTKQFLLVQEFACSGYWLPGGRVDAGETPDAAAIRETKEEAGIDIRLTGLLRLEYRPKAEGYVRMHFIFLAEPLDVHQMPKSIPDYESAGATWCPVDLVKQLPLRGPEPVQYFEYVAAGGAVIPLSHLYMK